MMQVKPRALLAGVASFAPVLRTRVCRGAGGTSSARYCYSVWLRHAVLALRCGFAPRVKTLAELGPGESLGIGLAAVLSGVDTYLALDAKRHVAHSRNLGVFDELIELFRQRAPIPDDDEFPEIFPKLDVYSFPREFLNDEMLARTLRSDRLAGIREGLLSIDEPGASTAVQIHYIAPWDFAESLPSQAVDMIISQAVMEHVEDIAHTYAKLYRWLRPGGFMSHNIDFRSHGLTWDWNGHWTLSDGVWRLVKGTRPYLINRLPHSAHIAALQRTGLSILGDIRREGPAIARHRLARRFAQLSDQDLRTSGVLLQAAKP